MVLDSSIHARRQRGKRWNRIYSDGARGVGSLRGALTGNDARSASIIARFRDVPAPGGWRPSAVAEGPLTRDLEDETLFCLCCDIPAAGRKCRRTSYAVLSGACDLPRMRGSDNGQLARRAVRAWAPRHHWLLGSAIRGSSA
jgi:hypothetical protein